ncbi:MAG TPA: ABC transporter ATP-binding protein [Vineibacter sp.]|nr:ABC transporter ATP-binding protein [Vineibacter sp.]
MTERADILEIAGLSRRFGGLAVINGLDLSVDGREILGIIGPNGAGKTTLFNLVAGVLRPSAGSIRYQGREISQLSTWDRCRLGIGRTYQIPRPFVHMSVFENVLTAAVHGGGKSIPQARERAEAMLELTGLADDHGRPAGELTLLDLKRLELCRALAIGPRLLLLDEIAGGLTDAEVDTLLSIIQRVHAEGTAIVWIEHVIRALRRASDRIAVLHEGAFIAVGAPEDVLNDPHVKTIYLGE